MHYVEAFNRLLKVTLTVSIQGPNASGKGAFSMGPSGLTGTDLAADRQKLFNGKKLATSTKSAYQLSWPIVLWSVLVLVLYGISYDALSHQHNTMVYIKMTQKTRIAASRVTYQALRISLEPVGPALHGG